MKSFAMPLHRPGGFARERPQPHNRWPHTAIPLLLAGLSTLGCLSPSRKVFFASCATSDECESSLCWQGMCTATCQSSTDCGGSPCTAKHCAPGPLAQADASSDVTQTPVVAPDSSATDGPATVQAGAKRVFVTSKNYTAALGGLAGADAICQSLANAAKLPGTYKAWLSDSNASPATRFSAGCKAGGPFTLVDGTVIAQDWAGLTSGSLLKALAITDVGGGPPAGNVCSGGKGSGTWTGTLNSGEVDKNRIGMMCADWTSNDAGLKALALWGQPFDPKAWSANGNCFLGGMTVCSRLATLYCFEQ